MEVELSRAPIRLPRLSDDEATAETLPTPLTTAHKALLQTATDAATKASEITADKRWSEPERQRQLSELCNATITELGPMAEVAAAIEASAAESEAAALRTAISKFDGARLLAIRQSLATRTREQRLSAVMRARAGDRETAAAIVSAPTEFSLIDGIDDRVLAGLVDRLVPDDVRLSVANTQFAVARFRAGLQASIDTLRRMTNTTPPMRERAVRVGA
jgi:hypothetical protein